MSENRLLSWLKDFFTVMMDDDKDDIGKLDRLHHWQYGFIGIVASEFAQLALYVKDFKNQIKSLGDRIK